MARNGSGTYVLPAGNPVVTGTTISSTVQNNTMTDIGTELTNSMPRDGQAPPTANLPMGGYKFTGLGAGSGAGESLRYEQLATAPTVIGLTNGSAAAPSLTFASDTDTGIYRSAADTMAMSFGGTQRHVFDAGTALFGRGQSTGDVALELATARSGNGSTYIDLIGDATYTDYGLRIVRNNTGANTDSDIAHRGTGALNIRATDAGKIIFITDSVERARITAGGKLLIGGATDANTSSVGINSDNIPLAFQASGAIGSQSCFQAWYDNATNLLAYVGYAAATTTFNITNNGARPIVLGNTAGTVTVDASGNTAATGSMSAATVAGSQVATAAQMETATATNLIVTPGRVQNHPGVAKAVVVFDGSGVGAGSQTIAYSYNVTSVTRSSAGVFTITVTTAFSSAAKIAITGTASNGGVARVIVPISFTTTTAVFQTVNVTPTVGESDYVSIALFGDQ